MVADALAGWDELVGTSLKPVETTRGQALGSNATDLRDGRTSQIRNSTGSLDRGQGIRRSERQGRQKRRLERRYRKANIQKSAKVILRALLFETGAHDLI